MAKYWLVGATWENVENLDRIFVNEGYWMLGWKQEDQPDQYAKVSEMKVGDRIAIKRMKGQGQKTILIDHIGIIKGVVKQTDRIFCTVLWVATDLSRDVESKGCFKSVHGPYPKDSWIEKIFCL